MEIIDGLDFLHSQHVLHRDLKSHNIFVMLDTHGNVTQLAIGDFDSAKRVSKDDKAKTFVGTPDYMAPEVVRHSGSYTKNVDIWSLGMVMYELMTLKRPYEDVNYYLVPDLIKSGKRPKMDRGSLPLTDHFDSLIDIWYQTTKLEPDERISLEEFREELDEILDELDNVSASDYKTSLIG